MRNSIVLLVVVLSALLITSRTNARDICLDGAPSAGLCCFRGPKDWPKLDRVTILRSEIRVGLLDIDALGCGLAPWHAINADVRLQTILVLGTDRTTLGISDRSPVGGSVTAPSCHYVLIHPSAADFDFDTPPLNFADRPLGFGISMEDSAELICAAIFSAPLSYASAAFNTN